MESAPSPLIGCVVRLEPLAEHHREGLRAACDADRAVFDEWYPVPMYGPHLDDWWAVTAAEQASGRRIAYAGVLGGEVVGCSCFFRDPANRRTEIGNTYWRPDVRGGAVNPEAKRLMMEYAFTPGGLFPDGALTVAYKVDAINVRSRAAVLKLGATFEGMLRQDRITWTGRVRDTCFYSILAEEWPAVRAGLDARLAGLCAP